MSSALCIEEWFLQSWDQIVNKTEKTRTSEKCGTCTLREVCNTCAAGALLETGRYDGVPDYVCRYTQKTVQLIENLIKKGPVWQLTCDISENAVKCLETALFSETAYDGGGSAFEV